MKRSYGAVVSLALGLGLALFFLTLPGLGQAQPGGAGEAAPVLGAAASAPEASGPMVSLLAALPPGDVGLSVAGSDVGTDNCYQSNKTQTLCFTVYNGSTDGEWIDGVTLIMPDDPSPSIPAWTASACGVMDAQDSVGYEVSFQCAIVSNQFVFTDNDADGVGEISNGASWSACVNVFVPTNYNGDRYVPWSLHGDDGSTEPGSTKIEQCTPLTLKPSQVTIEGCSGAPQSLDFELTNYGAGNVTVDFVYDAPDASFSGLTDIYLQQGEVITFTTQLEPRRCLQEDEVIVANLTAQVRGGGPSDTSTITQTITADAGWRRREDSPIPSMDNVVVWASYADGGLWSIGGYGSGGVAQRYDPGTSTWVTYTNPLTPQIEYPMDGCYGLNSLGQEIVVLFPDTIVTDTLHVFNITTRQWSTRPIPGFFPPEYIGHWGFDVVSLLGNPALDPDIPNENMCYLSGGNHVSPGGGTTRNLWRYDPEANGGEFVGNFKDAGIVFGFHASWYVPWVGGAGAICVAGGADFNHVIHNTTQCYDIAANDFNDPGVDLGTLPERWWGMADGWRINASGEYELWIANGVAQDGTLLPASAYIKEGMGDFAYGPPVPNGLYRLEGDAWNNQFYTLNGSRGGFWYSEFSLQLEPCPICGAFLPLVERSS